ncbi:MAG: hypothetical protein JO242_16935, partial [Streptosporangiaceae bacterium]|nr:hypothetical protein [Streptosporangiaceae bacterium]
MPENSGDSPSSHSPLSRRQVLAVASGTGLLAAAAAAGNAATAHAATTVSTATRHARPRAA